MTTTPRKAHIAIAYDFDGTLSPGNMQEYEFIPKLGMRPAEFWDQVRERARTQNADEILAYMGLMLERAAATKQVQFTRKAFVAFGRKITLFPGVDSWFERINSFGSQEGAVVEHFIISSGLKEMIEGTRIAREFRDVFASSFMYDQNGVACWPALAVNYTTKTQFLFRINKGVLDVWDNEKINQFVAKDERPFPFENMLYVGDGTTDVPCMKLVRDQGGHSIAVYPPKSRTRFKRAQELVTEHRAHFALPADYSAGGMLESVVKLVIRRVVAADHVRKAIRNPRTALRSSATEGASPWAVSGDEEPHLSLNAAEGTAVYRSDAGHAGAPVACPSVEVATRGTNGTQAAGPN